MTHRSFEFVSGQATVDPVVRGVKAEGEITLRCKVTKPVLVTLMTSETELVVDGNALGGGALEVAHDPAHEVAPDGEINVRIGGGVDTDAADDKAIRLQISVTVRLDTDEEQTLFFRAVTAGGGSKETVQITAA